ncbi:MAG: chemotaxis protein CheX [Spirochaetales bacterium]|nr:chemotaxis protein CheX [Spirochaetales bacterium]MCF7937995.1 chemotaxis protein CheX [Spirochaetales bacterium]
MIEKVHAAVLTAASEVFNEMGVDPVLVKEIEAPRPEYDVIASVGFTGELHGFLQFQGDKEEVISFISIISKLLGMEPEGEGFGPFQTSTLTELTNQLAGRISMHLEKSGINTNITPPTIMTGSNLNSDISSIRESTICRISIDDTTGLDAFFGAQ